jgi:hypothetical protein
MDAICVKDHKIVAEGPPRVNAIPLHRMSKLNTKAESFEILSLEVTPVPFLQRNQKLATNKRALNVRKPNLNAMQRIIPMHIYTTRTTRQGTTYTI